MNRADFYDAELARHHRHLRTALEVAAGEHVLDVGCGAGQTSRDAAAVAKSVLGVDISDEILSVARSRSAKSGLNNVTFELGDAQTHRFAASHFDLCISRFGVMFFADPAVAFANICRAMRHGARLVWMVWQSQDRNEWVTKIQRALTSSSPSESKSPAAFSLSDPANTADLLRAAGFSSIDFTAVHEPVFYGATVDAAYDALVDLQFAGVASASDNTKQRLRDLLGAHLTSEGVFFSSSAWIITASYKKMG